MMSEKILCKYHKLERAKNVHITYYNTRWPQAAKQLSARDGWSVGGKKEKGKQ